MGSRKTNASQPLDAEESRRRHEKFKEHLINATKPHKPFDALHNSMSELNSNIDDISKDDNEKSRLSADQEKHPNSINNGPDSSVAASVQAALNALQAGQLSLNQVSHFGIFSIKLICFIFCTVRYLIILFLRSVIGSTTCSGSPESRVLPKVYSSKYRVSPKAKVR